ncbi:hypothetical protein [Halochromatium roseum]|uniref:hypothetical protein n=1 Tax=Halochromatium roseum TaxID=391920 RepID=UPI001A912655|nr:hypothetical protein [Halochromatium roseum]MBK5940986.1 hypothetical protein [Halochromatium roseum]
MLWTANGKRIIVMGLRYTFSTLTWIESFGMRWNSSTVWIGAKPAALIKRVADQQIKHAYPLSMIRTIMAPSPP